MNAFEFEFEYEFAPHYLDLDPDPGTDDLRLHYVDEGPADGTAVVMVHGNPSWSYLYRNLIPHLSDHFRTIALDHIGCGRSDKPSGDRYSYSLAQRVADLGQLLDHLGLDKVHLIVHDWGGMIGTTWAVRNPDRVHSLVAMNTGAFHLPANKPLPRAIGWARTPGLGALLVRGLNAFTRGANRYCVTRAPMRREIAAGFARPFDSWAHRVAVHKFVLDIPLRPEHPSYDLVSATAAGLGGLADLPMLLCWGMRDKVFDHHFLAEWVRRFPGAEVHRFEDAGHYLLEDRGPQIYPRIREFLARNEHCATTRITG